MPPGRPALGSPPIPPKGELPPRTPPDAGCPGFGKDEVGETLAGAGEGDGAAKALPPKLGVAGGDVTVCPQTGHGPLTPAIWAGTVSVVLHALH